MQAHTCILHEILLYCRKADAGLAEFQCTLQLPAEFLINKAITYRYVISDGYTGSSVDVNDAPFEFLCHEDKPACRCMMIENFSSEGTACVLLVQYRRVIDQEKHSQYLFTEHTHNYPIMMPLILIRNYRMSES